MLALITTSPPDLAESALAGRALQGDRAAWEQLIAQHSRRVHVTLLAAGLSMDDAKDLTQDVWARLWSQIRTGALRVLQLPGIAVTQAQFMAKDLLRRRRTVQFRDDTNLAEADLRADETPVDSALSSAQTLARVRQALEQLPASQRLVFELAIEDGVPHAEIASRVGLSTQRVRQIIWEVRVRLRGHVKGERS